MKIRNIQQPDLAKLAEVFADAYKPENTGEYWTPDLAMPVVKYWFTRSPEDLKILAEDDNGEIQGAFFADIKPWWDGPRLIDGEFFVHTTAQSKGIGSVLMLEILKRGQKNYGALFFETITFQPETSHSLKWYKKIGFEVEKGLAIINGDVAQMIENLETQK